MPDIPQELIDAIIDQVPDSSLAACSLTATAFVPSSQRRLFRWMSLSTLSRYERTAALLASSPHLGQYVRSLALHIKTIPKDYAHLKAILSLLPEIERLSIVGDANTAPRNQLGQNPCLVDLMSLPSLTCVALHHLSDVPSSLISRALGSFVQVSVSFLSITDEDQSSAELPPPTDLWHLRVSMDVYDVIVPFVLQPKRLPHLQQLARLCFVFSPIPDALQPRFMALLAACSNTLEHLELELEAPLELPPLPMLYSLELWLDVDLAKNPTLLASIVSQTGACAPHLESLTLSLMDRPKRTPQLQHQWAPSAAEWSALDAALMDMPDLWQAIFSLRHFIWDATRYAAFVPYIEQKLPRAFDAELLGFSQQLAFPHPMDCFVD
ncbi:hypothetical protein B0H17DRAFT_1334233 [Mycena rosella]|uniref:F-box domain-containing protein n=1 Tax=Mycena rosella TaxID=1033263 RepID=A0AAD7G8I5_MYCRO|nr:hypothetical protein B0H17DRAFT_1334233 [Mycena rosella]